MRALLGAGRWPLPVRRWGADRPGAGRVLAVLCVAAVVAVFFGDRASGINSTVGSLGALPVLVAAWFLSRRSTMVVTALALGLRTLLLVLGNLTAVTFVSQAVVLVVVALAGSVAAASSRRAVVAQAAAAQATQAQLILESALDAVISIDDEGITQLWSRRAEEMFGWTAEEVIGRPIVEFIIPPAMREAHTRGLARFRATGTGRVIGSVLSLDAVDRSGRAFPIELAISSAQRSGSRATFIAFLRDISERRRAESALSSALAEAEEASSAKSQYLSRMSHELRTPLTVILGFAGLLEMESPRDDQRASVAMIIKAGDHLLRMIDELLDLSRVDSGREEFAVEPVSVIEVIDDCVDLVTLAAAQRHVTLHRDLEAGAGLSVLGDRQRLKQVLLNLLTNAVKYNREGGHVDISARTTVDGRVRITVRDTGPGIAPDLLPRLFQPFDRLGAERTTVAGTGLGLALSKHLVELMSGAIGVETTSGRGASFWVELASATADRSAAGSGAPSAATAIASRQHQSMLYVEDNLANLELVERTLQHRPSLRMIPLMQGGLALELAAQHHPDLVLLDLQLPDIDGEVVLRRLKEDARTRHIPVIILSADASDHRAAQMRDAGADAFLAKPIRVRELLRAVDDALVRERQGEVSRSS